MKENRVEFIFIGIIILGFAIWKISEMVKTRCYQRQTKLYEGFLAEKAAAATTEPNTGLTTGIFGTDPANTKLLSEVQHLVKKNDTDPLSTENFTVDTPEYEMTLHQRRRSATALDHPSGFQSASAPAPLPSLTEYAVDVKEGMENADADTKDVIERNITSINPSDSQSKFKLRDYYIKAAHNAFHPDKFKNSNVSMDAFLYVIVRGCRFIDFEVFYTQDGRSTWATTKPNWIAFIKELSTELRQQGKLL